MDSSVRKLLVEALRKPLGFADGLTPDSHVIDSGGKIPTPAGTTILDTNKGAEELREASKRKPPNIPVILLARKRDWVYGRHTDPKMPSLTKPEEWDEQQCFLADRFNTSLVETPHGHRIHTE